MTGPPSTLNSTSGSISARAARPVFVGLPVDSSTNSGIATIETRVPVIEMASAVSQP